jgi:hypothetical protein
MLNHDYFSAISHYQCLINFYLMATSTQTYLTPSQIQFRYIHLENIQEMIRKSFGQQSKQKLEKPVEFRYFWWNSLEFIYKESYDVETGTRYPYAK